ncbi:MAG: hypothetical protein K0R93_897 [Anaerosolibacter sp.]|jgi:hypothetical protein|nr:hypothetical protein [Anaerosolibacter sp.]
MKRRGVKVNEYLLDIANGKALSKIKILLAAPSLEFFG